MVHGRPLQLVNVVNGHLIFNREVLATLVTQCGDYSLAIYTVAGEFRKGKTTILNIFLAFNHFNELGQDWKQHNDVTLSGFEARGGSIKVTNGIWIWSKPFFSTDRTGKKVAIILMDTQGTFDQDTSSAVNSFIFGFSLAVSSTLMYNNMKLISSHDVDSLVTFGMTFIPIIGRFQTLSFLVRDWDDEDRFPFGWRGGDMMINDLVNPRSCIDAKLSESRSGIRNMFQSVTGFLLPRPGLAIERAKKGAVTIGDLDTDFVSSVDDLCREIFVRNVKPFTYEGKEMNGSHWLAIFDNIIQAYGDGKVMDPGFHKDAFTGSSAKTIKDFMVVIYQEEMLARIMDETKKTGLTYVTDSFLNETDSRIRNNVMKSFEEKIAHFGRQDAIHEQMVKEVSKWFNDRRQENARAMADYEKIKKSREELEGERIKHENQRKKLANQMEQLKRDSQAQIEQAMRIGREEAARVQRECNARESMMLQQMQENNNRMQNTLLRVNEERARETEQHQNMMQQQQQEMNRIQSEKSSFGFLDVIGAVASVVFSPITAVVDVFKKIFF